MQLLAMLLMQALTWFALFGLLVAPLLFLACLFSAKVRTTFPLYRLVFIAWVFALAAFIASMLTASRVGIDNSKIARTRNAMVQLSTAVLSFQTEYGVLPDAKDNATLIKVLSGQVETRENPRDIVFLTPSHRELDSQGEFIDPWGTPYRISVNDQPTVISAGPDKQWGTSDDLKYAARPAP